MILSKTVHYSIKKKLNGEGYRTCEFCRQRKIKPHEHFFILKNSVSDWDSITICWDCMKKNFKYKAAHKPEQINQLSLFGS